MRITTARIYPYPRAKVWTALTSSAALASWLMPNDFRLEKGHEFTFNTKARGNFDGIVHCKVIDFLDQTSLTYSWHGGGKAMPTPTVVKWTLEDHPQGCKLSLNHSGFEGFGGWMVKTMLGLGWKWTLLRKNLMKYLRDEA